MLCHFLIIFRHVITNPNESLHNHSHHWEEDEANNIAHLTRSAHQRLNIIEQRLYESHDHEHDALVVSMLLSTADQEYSERQAYRYAELSSIVHGHDDSGLVVAASVNDV